MFFKEIIGHQHIKQDLILQVNSGKLHHAHLLLGKMGYNTFALALALVQYIYCKDKQADNSCGTCSNCLKIKHLNHPDIHFTFPTFESKYNCASLLPDFKKIIEETQACFDIKDWLEYHSKQNAKIRAVEFDTILNTLSMYAYEEGYKTQIIWYADYMEKESNKLLKILEEPSDKSLFILIAASSDDILPTILSRCNIHKINALTEDELKQELVQRKSEFTEASLDKAYVFSEGDVIEAVRYLKDLDTDFSYEEMLIQYLKGVVSFGNRNFTKTNDLIEISLKIAALSKENQKKFLDFILYFLKQVLQYKFLEKSDVNDSLIKGVQFFSTKLEIDQIEHWTSLIDQTYYAIEGNANSKITFVSLAIESGMLMNRKEFEKMNHIKI